MSPEPHDILLLLSALSGGIALVALGAYRLGRPWSPVHGIRQWWRQRGIDAELELLREADVGDHDPYASLAQDRAPGSSNPEDEQGRAVQGASLSFQDGYTAPLKPVLRFEARGYAFSFQKNKNKCL